MARTRYTLIYEHGDKPNQWTVSVKELPECHTFGRGLAQTRARILEALALWEGAGSGSAEFREVLPLDRATRLRIQRMDALKQKMERLAQEVSEQRAEIITALEGEWSRRDIGQLLEISHQRVSQVAVRPVKKGVKKKRSRRATPSAR